MSMTSGKAYLIGAGPGAADLISVRGRRALLAADVVLVDQLLPRSILADLEIPTGDKQVAWLADKHPRWSQSRINGWITSQVRQGRVVARLKGGDPFVFGQAEEETAHLSRWNIPWEVIPGPSSFSAVLTSAGYPSTRRQQGRSFAVATARTAGGRIAGRFPSADSLVILMGVAALDQIVETLIAQGWPGNTPAAVIERGTLCWERRVESPLSSLAAAADRAGVLSPACVTVGDAALRLRACRERPTILFTGLDPTNFRILGNLLHWPALEITTNPEMELALRETLLALQQGGFDWVVFADRIGVTSFFPRLDQRDLDSRVLAGTRIATLRAGVADRLREHGIRANAVADGGAIEALGNLHGKSVLIIEGTHASRRLFDRFADRGAAVRNLVLNRVAPHRDLGRHLPRHDVIYFVSPSGVRAYYRAYGSAAFQAEAWCLGKDTQHELRSFGIEAKVMMTEGTSMLSASVPA